MPKGGVTVPLLNLFHSWYLPHPVKVRRDKYLATTTSRAKMWSLMVNHANAADYVLTPSDHFRKKLIHYGVTKPIKVFPNGYPDANFPDSPTVKILNPDETLKIIWHSRASGEKRLLPFLEALTQVTGKYHLDVYGGGPDLQKAVKFARQSGLNATFHGDTPFPKVQDAISNSHLDVLVSYNYDTFGMTLIEAEAHGVPVFFCDPDMREIVPTGGYILSADETPVKMAAAINGLLTHPEKIEQMSKVMLTHRKEILVSNRIKILEKLFNSIIGQDLHKS